MESLIADFIQQLIADFTLDYACTQFRDFTIISSFFKLFDNSWGNSYIQLVVIMI